MHNKEKSFILITCILSMMQGGLYILDGIKTGFTVNDYLMPVLDFLYIPLILLLKEKGFSVFLGLMGGALVFLSVTMQEAGIYNNFSALLVCFIAIMIMKRKKIIMSVYIVGVAIASILADVPLYLFLIHISRALWLFAVNYYVINNRYTRKPLSLLDDERRLLEQLTEGHKLKKELELDGMSESTIRRRLKAAKTRNGITTTEELKELYITVYKNK